MFGSSAIGGAGAVALARDRVLTGNLAVRALLVAAFAVGFVIRLAPVLAADFPLNDGGMFYAMIRDLQQAHYQLPLFTSYNNAAIPFAYPPLPFYVAGLLDDLTPLSLLDILRFVPALATVLTLVAAYLLARTFHSSAAGVAASMTTYALVPDSFVWALMGGGLTRSFGMLFALLGMREAYRFYAEDGPRAVPWLILWSSLTIVSHLEYAFFLAVTCAALCISTCRSRRALLLSALVAVATLVCTAPWWAFALLHHGWLPFAAALQTGYGATADVAAGVITLEQAIALAGVLLLLASRQRRLFFLGWIGLILLFNFRSLLRFAAVPIALANGQIVAGPPPLSNDRASLGGSGRFTSVLARTSNLGFAVVMAFLLFAEVATSLALFKGLSHLGQLAPEERSAMAWVDQTTPPASEFLVVSGGGWAIDRAAEWFPVLANRTSVTTVQGTEWLPGGAFQTAVDAHEALDLCTQQDGRCLERWADGLGVSFTHVYVPARQTGDCCGGLREALRHDPAYRPIYETAGASVFARVVPVPG